MPPRSAFLSRGSFCPPNDNATYRDLLYFEERLKTNAASLQRRKSRYQLFLVHLLIVIAFLLFDVLLPPQSSLLAIPYKLALQRVLPDVYTPDVEVTLSPYFVSGLLLVSVTTLVLFFASGMYSEKIAYANKYVPHANKALRSFNMYLNMRQPPLRSKLPFNPLAFLFALPEDARSSTAIASRSRSRTPSPPPSSSSSSSSTPRRTSSSSTIGPTSLPIPSIPPASNPRGELIFSSRVDRTFREGYERYRANFERRRAERERAARRGWWTRAFSWTWAWAWRWLFGSSSSSASDAAVQAARTASSGSGPARGRTRVGSRDAAATPSSGDGIVMRPKERSASSVSRGSSTSPCRARTPSPPDGAAREVQVQAAAATSH